MKNIDDLIDSAAQLAERGHTRGEIADELNVSRETATWLVERGGVEVAGPTGVGDPNDIHVDWSTIGRDSGRLAHAGAAMASLLGGGDEAAVTVGIEKAGVPLATTVARELGTALSTYAPRKHQWDEGDLEGLGGSFSRNFARIDGCDCYVVDDTITSGTTMTETIEAVREAGGDPVAGVVLVDKLGVGELEGVPIESLVQVIRVGSEG